MSDEEFGVCTTFVSAKGIIRTTFELNAKFSDILGMDDNHFMPVKVIYKSKRALDVKRIA